MAELVRRRHRMPFGAELAEHGVRFRLWAPGAERVDLVLASGGAARTIAMQTLPEGWFEVVTAAAQAGSRYRFRIDGKLEVADPASRFNPEDAQGPSMVVNPCAFTWQDDSWRARPWHEAVLYELHVGTFTAAGTFAGVEQRLDYLVELGVTVIELMPIADFPGARGWGYDGVLPYAPDSAYGTPAQLKSLIAAAHRTGLAVMLDVVYNHFGPEGNYLHQYADEFFTDRHHTPWGAAINFDGPGSATVRSFFIHNALYWLEEYRFDGLRFDAVHAVIDDSEPHIFKELASALRAGPGSERPIYLVLENNANEARYLGAPAAAATHDAQWNDDVHHCLHVILTGETDGYYADYAKRPHELLCRSLAQGFAYQGEVSHYQGGKVRGEPSAHLPPTAFVSFLQNHDQIGNRALGERIASLVTSDAARLAAAALLLLAPPPPMLFMGEEWQALTPFAYFCDMSAELTVKIREGRRQEFAQFGKFAAANELPDPAAVATFQAAKLDWSQLPEPAHAHALEQYRRLLAIRHRDITPLIPQIRSSACMQFAPNGAFAVDWRLEGDAVLHLLANLSSAAVPSVGRAGRVIFATHAHVRGALSDKELAPWSVTWLLEHGRVGA